MGSRGPPTGSPNWAFLSHTCNSDHSTPGLVSAWTPGTCWDCSMTLHPHLLHSFPTNVQAKDQLFSAEGPDFLLSPGIIRGPFTLNFTSLYLAEKNLAFRLLYSGLIVRLCIQNPGYTAGVQLHGRWSPHPWLPCLQFPLIFYWSPTHLLSNHGQTPMPQQVVISLTTYFKLW